MATVGVKGLRGPLSAAVNGSFHVVIVWAATMNTSAKIGYEINRALYKSWRLTSLVILRDRRIYMYAILSLQRIAV